MKIVRNINNNVSICLDDSGREVIAFGKGIGFLRPPNKIPNSKIEKTFFNLDDMNSDVLKIIRPEIIRCSIRIVKTVERNLKLKFMPTTFLALSDHINFAVERKEKNIQYDIGFQHQTLAKNPQMINELSEIVDIIDSELNLNMDMNEASVIACHLIDNQVGGTESEINISHEFKKECVRIIDKIYQIEIDRNSYNYSRFIMHLEYLITRLIERKQIKNINGDIYESLVKEYPLANKCVRELNAAIKIQLNASLNSEEKLYLLIHINRGWVKSED